MAPEFDQGTGFFIWLTDILSKAVPMVIIIVGKNAFKPLSRNGKGFGEKRTGHDSCVLFPKQHALHSRYFLYFKAFILILMLEQFFKVSRKSQPQIRKDTGILPSIICPVKMLKSFQSLV
jgi:hypothetical protein